MSSSDSTKAALRISVEDPARLPQPDRPARQAHRRVHPRRRTQVPRRAHRQLPATGHPTEPSSRRSSRSTAGRCSDRRSAPTDPDRTLDALLLPRRPRHLTGSVVADPGFCFESATRPSGSPRLSSLPAILQKRREAAVGGGNDSWVTARTGQGSRTDCAVNDSNCRRLPVPVTIRETQGERR